MRISPRKGFTFHNKRGSGYLLEITNDELFKDFMESLNELEVKIFKDRFFLDKTQSTIAKELEISQMTVSRIEKKIVEKLRKEYEKQL